MMRKIELLCAISPLALILAAAGCTSPRSAADAQAFASPIELQARLSGASNIDLTWKNRATAEGGCWVEFTTPGSEFVKLDPLWPNETTYQHSDLAPGTKHIYRIVPFFGVPTPPVSITTGPAGSSTTTNAIEEGPIDAEPGSKPVAEGPKKSIRHFATFAEAMPDGVTVSLYSPTTVDVRWRDRARDEDGYLVEVAADANGPFQVCALLQPDTTSFRKVHLPPDMKIYFRVRAFFYGKPSNLADATTPEVAESPAASEMSH